jgi:hypothetical protein
MLLGLLVKVMGTPGDIVFKRGVGRASVVCLFGSVLLLIAGVVGVGEAFERTEKREPCHSYEPTKQPLFGDLHIHSSLSFDSYVSSQRNRPAGAYLYAQGEPITLPDEDGAQTIVAQIARPLDFAAVTDHAEFLGQIGICTADPSKLGYWWPHCAMTRSTNLWTQLLAASWWTKLGVMDGDPSYSFACTLSDCGAAGAAVWDVIQLAAENAYDRTSECRFTSFVGYEYTDAPQANNLHRNVIFRNERVPDTPYSTYETGSNNFPRLWELLREHCIDADTGCDVLAIPHNPNLAGGMMFRDPLTPREAADRLFFEPVIEITQHKGSSECRFDRLAGRGLFTEDELCTDEQVVSDNLTMLGSVNGEVRTKRAAAVPIEEFARRNMIRNVLKDGLAIERSDGVNPFQMGFIGSTDTHSAAPGSAEEYNYVGHLGRRDSGYRNVQDHFFSNPGGLAVVWAEENSRDAIFEAIRRKETYATSGTRPIVRFFAGRGLPQDLCGASDVIEQAYTHGVPMGGRVVASDDKGPLRFLISAQKDAGLADHPGTDLQRVQVIKGWVEADGSSHEQVFDVAGDANNGAWVDSETCRPTGTGADSLCTVWEDPDFDATESAFYYVRVLENPTCRWSTLHCRAAGVDPFSKTCADQAAVATARAQERGADGDVYGKCCLREQEQPFYSPVIQERAWTSPIWYEPGGRGHNF